MKHYRMLKKLSGVGLKARMSLRIHRIAKWLPVAI